MKKLTDSQIFSYQLQIKESHLDTFGHVNHATYVTLFEEARWEFITQNGKDLNEVMRTREAPVILEIGLKYKREVLNREHVKIVSQCTHFQRSKMIISQTLYNQAGEVACSAELVCVLFDLDKRAPMAPTKEWLEAIGVKLPMEAQTHP